MKELVKRHEEAIEKFTVLDLQRLQNVTYLYEFDRAVQYVPATPETNQRAFPFVTLALNPVPPSLDVLFGGTPRKTPITAMPPLQMPYWPFASRFWPSMPRTTP